MLRALIVVAKEPSAGKTKTRLCPPLSAADAVALYTAFLLDTLELMGQVRGVTPVIAHTPPQAGAYFRRIAPAGFELVAQHGQDLGERLDNVLRHFLERGYGQAVVMNSDGPTLPQAILQSAFVALDDPHTDVVLGPSEDGGYYLIGLKKPCAALFRVAMSTATVREETLELARQQGLRVACLAPWYDVDTPEDLQRLAAELRTLPPDRAPRTRQWLGRWRSEDSAAPPCNS